MLRDFRIVYVNVIKASGVWGQSTVKLFHGIHVLLTLHILEVRICENYYFLSKLDVLEDEHLGTH
jgi:hypothetical protein